METTEKIVEAYVRYINGWFTIPNIKCQGQFEIDLLAVDAAKDGRIFAITSRAVFQFRGFFRCLPPSHTLTRS